MTSPPLPDHPALALHHERLRAFLRTVLRDEHEAEEALQDAWVRALASSPREPSAFGAWLRAIARRAASNRRRSEARRREREAAVAGAEPVPSSREIAERVELERRVLAVMDSLPEPDRTLLRDHALGGLTTVQIAQRDGVAVVTVKARLRRARARMRAALERAGVEGDRRRVVPAGPWRLPAVPLFGGSLVMKKLALVACAVVCTSLLLVGLFGADPGADRPSADAARVTPAGALAPIDDLGPAAVAELGDRERRSATEASTEAAAGPPPARDWIARGRVMFRDGATGELPRVVLDVALYAGYELEGEPLETARITSDADGAIEWRLADPGRTVSLSMDLVEAHGHDAHVTRHHRAVVGEGPPTSLHVRVAPRDAVVEGVVRESASAPEPGAPITDALVEYGSASTRTDARGEYRLAVPSRGYGAVIASAEGYRRGGATPGGLRPGETTRVDVELDPAPGPEWNVHGYVRDARGAVIAGARVRCRSAQPEEVVTDATGHYTLRGVELEPGVHVGVEAEADGFATSERSIVAEGDPRPDGRQLDFVLTAGARIAGIVLDANEDPVRGARVWLGPDVRLVANRVTFSDDDGRFELENVSIGPTLLGVRKRGRPDHVSEAHPSEGEVLELRIVLAQASTLTGLVVDADDAPVAGALVTARRAASDATGPVRELGSSGTTDADGRFAIEGVPEGELEVGVRLHGVLPTSADVTHPSDEDLVLRVERAIRIAGLVTDASTGDPIESFVVRLGYHDDDTLGPWFRGIDGSWIFGGRSFSSPDGRWTSDAKDPFGAGVWTYVEVQADGYETLRLGPLRSAADEVWEHRLERR